MSRFESFAEIIAGHAEHKPQGNAAVFARADGSKLVEEPLTYAELDRAGRSMGAWLQERCAPGDRVLLLYPPGLEFLKSFVGCLYAGVTPVPAPLPGGHKHHLTRATGIALDAAVAVVLTDSGNLQSVSEWLNQDGLDDLICVPTDAMELSPPAGWTIPEIGPESLAFLQYTSGSTSDPKGVMVSQANLLHNVGLIEKNLDLGPDSDFSSWLPHYHDMGLIGLLLTPLHLGSTAYLMSPTEFLKRPQLWLQLIADRKVAVSSAPNFAYELCARRLTDEQVAALDLSHWRHACNGAEPIDARTLDRFATRFAAAGFRPGSLLPCYGMAETTLFITGTRADQPPVVTQVDGRALEQNVFEPVAPGADGPWLVSSGVLHDDLDVRVVDPQSRQELPAGRVGEIWVRGGSVARGYWAKEEETERIFRAVTTDGESGFLRTGDLGVRHDGELYITGRIKEMLIIHGRNLYPHDVEREVRSVNEAFAGLAGSVFSVTARREEIVVVQELKARGWEPEQLRALALEVKKTVGERIGAHVANVVIVRQGQVRRTTSGKIQRSLMRELFMADALEALHEELDAETRLRYRAVEAAAVAESAPVLVGAGAQGNG